MKNNLRFVAILIAMASCFYLGNVYGKNHQVHMCAVTSRGLPVQLDSVVAISVFGRVVDVLPLEALPELMSEALTEVACKTAPEPQAKPSPAPGPSPQPQEDTTVGPPKPSDTDTKVKQ